MRSREFSQPKRDLIIFDIDDTLLHTTAKINVVKDGRVIRQLTNQEFNHYTLQPGEAFDFGEFQNAEKFNQESRPIEPMINKLKTILDHAPNSDVIMLTARSDFDDRDLFLKTFIDLGIDMRRVHVHRAGNLEGDAIPAEKKAVYVRRYADTGKYGHIRLYDDSRTNLVVFKALEKEYPNIDFRAYYVGPQGTTSPLREDATSLKDHKDNFVEMFKKFIPIAMHYLKLDSLPRMQFQAHIHDNEQPTFGRYVNEENTLYVALMNRHPNDILRTIAHELCHHKQNVEHQLGPESGTTGSPEENQANQMAGIIMRHFNKKYPEYLNSKPITESQDQEMVAEKWSQKYKRSINCTNPKGFSQRAHCQGRKKNEDVEQDPGQPIPFPQGTTVVDVSDPYDWYKLGMVISDLDDANPKIFGKGSPSTVVAFGSEEEEHKLLPYLKRLGLKLHDVDRPEDVQKAIPAKAVLDKMQENFADGRNPQDKGDSKRYKVPTKGSISSLRKIAKHGGRRGQLAHWMANMKSGKKKANEGAVEDLEKDLKNPYGYDAIDHMMTTIAKKHNISPKKLHDMFVEKNGKIPDTWIKNKK